MTHPRREEDARPFLDAAILGMPKSGSSSLYDWLAAHPEVTGSDPDETYFFMDPDHPLAGCRGGDFRREGYEGLDRFFPEDGGNRCRVEATPHHIFQRTARDALGGEGDGPLLIVILREPANRLRSSFLFTQNNLAAVDPQLGFARYADGLLQGRFEALSASFSSPASRWIARRELAYGRYVDWLAWWQERVPADRMAIVLFEELVQQPARVMSRLAPRLGIDAAFYQEFDFSARNATTRIGHQRLHRWARRLGPLVPRGRLKRRLQSLYLRWQSRRAPAITVDDEALAALRAHYAPANRALEDRFGIPVSEWWDGPGSTP